MKASCKNNTRVEVKTLCMVLAMLSLFLSIHSTYAEAGEPDRITILKNVPYPYIPPAGMLEESVSPTDSVIVKFDGSPVFHGTAGELFEEGVTLQTGSTGKKSIVIENGQTLYRGEVRSIDGIISILPPLIAIAFALIFRQVILALLAGIWLGSFFVSGFEPVSSILRIVDHYVIGTLSDPGEGPDHIAIIVFTLLLGGMVGITTRMGGMKGIVDRVSRIATTPKRGQFAVWLMGMIIFFDDYTNTLIVGNSTRPLTDRLKISREKLSYIVDSTAAPIASLAIITSWIGFEISLIGQALTSIGVDRNPLAVFASSIPYSFYPILALLFVLFIIITGRDYSLMLAAERRARTTGKVSSETARPLSNMDSDSIALADGAVPRAINGVIPIAVSLIVTFIGLLKTGAASMEAAGESSFGFIDALKASDSFKALLWGSFSGCIAAAILAVSQRLIRLGEVLDAWINGIKSMLPAFVILVLAWCIGKVCTELHTADYLVHNLSGILSPRFIPMIVFLIAMGISFSTGTSWGTMSILTPIVIPLVYGSAESAGITGGPADHILFASVAAILSGAVFGDHCSPISDTTIMSSMASTADHIDHVKTQLPYAATVGLVSLVFGYLLLTVGVPAILCLVAGAASLLIVLRAAGRDPGERPGKRT